MMKQKIQNFCNVIQIILKRFSLDTNIPNDCETYEEAMDRMLEPKAILYKRISAEDIFPDNKNEYIIAFHSDGSPCAVLPNIFGNIIVFADNRKQRLNKKNARFAGNAYIINRPFPKGDGGFADFIMLTLRLIRPAEYLILILAALMFSLLGLILPQITNHVINELVPAGLGFTEKIFIYCIILFTTIGFLRAAILLLKNCFMALVRNRISMQTESALMAKMLLLPESFFEKMSTGGIPLRLLANCTIVEAILSALFETTLLPVFSLIYLPQMFSFSPVLVFTAIAFFILEIFLGFVCARLRWKNQIEINHAGNRRNSFLYDTLSGMHKIHAYHAENHMRGEWLKKCQELLDYQYDPPLILKLEPVLPIILISLFTVLQVLILKPAGISTGDYLAFSSSFGLFTTSVLLLNNLLSIISQIPAMLEFVGPIFKTDSENTEESAYVKSLDGNVSFQNVYFSYAKNGLYALNNVSVTAKKGEKIAIVGPSGCGKSTFLQLLIGFLSPDKGKILYDGKDVSGLNLKSLRRKMGIVLQISRLMPGTLASNLRFVRNDATDDELWEAVDKASLRPFVNSLEHQLDTVLPDNQNCGLSGGQRQLVLLARSFVCNPNIMIFDEAFSALDTETTRSVFDILHTIDATVFMVTHRISSTKDFDRILVFDKGKIVEEGSFNELVKLNGVFTGLALSQNVISENDISVLE